MDYKCFAHIRIEDCNKFGWHLNCNLELVNTVVVVNKRSDYCMLFVVAFVVADIIVFAVNMPFAFDIAFAFRFVNIRLMHFCNLFQIIRTIFLFSLQFH